MTVVVLTLFRLLLGCLNFALKLDRLLNSNLVKPVKLPLHSGKVIKLFLIDDLWSQNFSKLLIDFHIFDITLALLLFDLSLHLLLFNRLPDLQEPIFIPMRDILIFSRVTIKIQPLLLVAFTDQILLLLQILQSLAQVYLRINGFDLLLKPFHPPLNNWLALL